MKIGLNVCGGISAERHDLYILSYKLTLFGETGMTIRLDICGGISSERHKV